MSPTSGLDRNTNDRTAGFQDDMLHDQDQDERPPEPTTDGRGLLAGHDADPTLVHMADGADELWPLLSELEARGVQRVGDFHELSARLQDAPEARAVIFYRNPETFLAERLVSGEAIEASLESWRKDTEQLLAVFRRDRRRVTLVDGHAVLATPEIFLRQIGARLALGPGTVDKGREPRQQSAGLAHLVANQALRQDPIAARLASELEASSLPIGPAYQVDFDKVVACLDQEREQLSQSGAPKQPATPEPSAAIDYLKEQNETLLHQLRETQEALEVQYLDHRNRKTELSKLRDELDQLRVVARRAKLARDSIESEFRAAREAWVHERKSLTDRLKWSADDLAAIRNSLSWRLTAPLRRLIGIFTGGSKL